LARIVELIKSKFIRRGINEMKRARGTPKPKEKD
jgi:hypothetical protein